MLLGWVKSRKAVFGRFSSELRSVVAATVPGVTWAPGEGPRGQFLGLASVRPWRVGSSSGDSDGLGRTRAAAAGHGRPRDDRVRSFATEDDRVQPRTAAGASSANARRTGKGRPWRSAGVFTCGQRIFVGFRRTRTTSSRGDFSLSFTPRERLERGRRVLACSSACPIRGSTTCSQACRSIDRSIDRAFVRSTPE